MTTEETMKPNSGLLKLTLHVVNLQENNYVKSNFFYL